MKKSIEILVLTIVMFFGSALSPSFASAAKRVGEMQDGYVCPCILQKNQVKADVQKVNVRTSDSVAIQVK